MSLPKINSKFLLPVFIIFSNFWIYKIFSQNVFIGTALIIAWLLILLKPKKKVLVCSIMILALLQFQTTSVKSLVLLDNDQQRVQQERIRSYPLTYIDLGIKVIWLKPEKWIEENNMIIGLSRFEENFYSNLDINKYFFGGFPRNKPEDFEKFPFAYLPIFVMGIFVFIKKKLFWDLGVLFLFPVFLLSFLGSDNRFGPFILLPFFILTFLKCFYWLKEKFKNSNLFYYTFVISIILSFVLQISYGRN